MAEWAWFEILVLEIVREIFVALHINHRIVIIYTRHSWPASRWWFVNWKSVTTFSHLKKEYLVIKLNWHYTNLSSSSCWQTSRPMSSWCITNWSVSCQYCWNELFIMTAALMGITNDKISYREYNANNLRSIHVPKKYIFLLRPRQIAFNSSDTWLPWCIPLMQIRWWVALEAKTIIMAK